MTPIWPGLWRASGCSGSRATDPVARRRRRSRRVRPQSPCRGVVQAAGVVGVQMRHHDAADIAHSDAELLELRPDLLLGLDPLANRVTEDRVPAREVAGRSRIACSKRRRPWPTPSHQAVVIATVPDWIAWIFIMNAPLPFSWAWRGPACPVRNRAGSTPSRPRRAVRRSGHR